MTKMLSIIVPVFNEEKNINEFLNRLVLTLEKINEDYEVIFILDPSTDKTEELILDQIKKNNKINLLYFHEDLVNHLQQWLAYIMRVVKDV